MAKNKPKSAKRASSGRGVKPPAPSRTRAGAGSKSKLKPEPKPQAKPRTQSRAKTKPTTKTKAPAKPSIKAEANPKRQTKKLDAGKTPRKAVKQLPKKAAKKATPKTARAGDTTPSPRPWFLYVLRCADGSLYCGITPDLNKRLEKHTKGTGARYTRGRGPLTLLRSWPHTSMSAALKAEAAFKNLTRRAKEARLAAMA